MNQYRAIVERAGKISDKELGLLLINSGYLPQEEILANLQGYFTEAVRRLFTWVEGSFRFEAEMMPPTDRINVRIDLENIIIEGSRQLREWEQLSDEIPSLEMALKFTDRPLKNVNLSVEEWRVVSFINPKNTMKQIAQTNKMTDLEIRRIVYGLLQAGLVQVEVVHIIDAYLAAGDGDPSGLAMLNLLASSMSFDSILGDLYNKAATVDMYEGIESISLGNSIMGAPYSESTWPMTVEWPSEFIRKDLREFQETNVDMLLVNGTVDFLTSPTNLDETKPYFHNAQTVLLSEFSHIQDVTTQQPEAFEPLITTYYDTGVADDSLYVYQPLSFEPSMSLAVAAKLLVAGMIVILVLIIWVGVVVVRRIQRRQNAHR